MIAFVMVIGISSLLAAGMALQKEKLLDFSIHVSVAAWAIYLLWGAR